MSTETESKTNNELSQTIRGVDASNVFSSTHEILIDRQGFDVRYTYEDMVVIDKAIGLNTSKVVVKDNVLQQVTDDLAALVPEMADLSQQVDLGLNALRENSFPRYAISQALIEQGIEPEIPVSVARADTFLTNENGGVGLRIIEINSKCPEAQAWTPGLIRRITGGNDGGPISAVVEGVSQHQGRRVGVVVWPNDAVKGNEAPFIEEELEILREKGVVDNYLVASPIEVSKDQNGILIAGQRVDWVYRYHGPDDILFAHSPDPTRNGVTRPDVHPEITDLTGQLGGLYGNNRIIDYGTYRLQVAGVMWKLMQEGHHGKAVVYPGARAARLGYKGLFPYAYAGEGLRPETARAARRILTPSFNLDSVDYVPETAVLKLTNSSGGADVIVGKNDTQAITHALRAHVGIQLPLDTDPNVLWNTLVDSLKQRPAGWIVQPQIYPGNFDLKGQVTADVNPIPYDFDPWLTRVGDKAKVGPAVIRFKAMTDKDTNRRINVVQGGRFTALRI